MWRPYKAASLIAWALLAVTSHARAAALSDYTGRWAATANDRNIIVIDLVFDKDNQSISGTIQRPTSAKIAPPNVFYAIKGPVSQTIIERSRIEQNRLRFDAVRPTAAKQRSAYEMSLTGPDQALLTLVGAPIAPLPLIRVDKRAVVAAKWDEERSFMIDDHMSSNAAMTQLFNEDQSDRVNVAAIDWNVVGKADAARREATRKLLSDGSLHTGADFQRAAFIFQHGDQPGDFLLAHTLAMIAIAKGKYEALWIGTASLDRYLHAIDQPQIYGTQIKPPGDQPANQTAFDPELISDALRQQLGVPSLAQQEEQLEKLNESQAR
jgi:hypothetical protein